MEGEEVGLVLAQASELRSKISNFIGRHGGDGGGAAEEAAEDDEESESLFSIRDALESLEQQLAALQNLQHQQRYEREATLAQIDRSRRILVGKLKEYKGDEMEVIHEALAFAGGNVELGDNLLLPPYSSHLPDLFVLEDLYPSRFNPKEKLSGNRLTSNYGRAAKKSMDELEHKGTHPVDRNRPKGIRLILGIFFKSVITFVGVVSALGLAGFKPTFTRRGSQFNIMEVVHQPGDEDRQAPIQCPPGKVMVVEDGKTWCIVKERVEIPFESDVTYPNISYGLG